jgi:tetratricopeptide (TPR) repeat protein
MLGMSCLRFGVMMSPFGSTQRMLLSGTIGAMHIIVWAIMKRPSKTMTKPLGWTLITSIPRINKGAALNGLGRYFEAIEACDVALNLDNRSVDAWINKGNSYYDFGKYSEAVNAYDEVLVLYPSHVDVLCNKGIVLAMQGKYGESIQAYDEALRLDPNNVKARNNREASICRLGDCTAHENGISENVGGSYLGNSDTKIYHHQSCVWVKKIDPKNRIWFTNLNEARSAGFKPCEKCNPP